LVVADLYRYKGVEQVVRALASVNGPYGPHLVVCGRPAEPDYLLALKKQATSLGLADRVHFRGQVAHAEVLALMRGARACIASSRFENLSRIPSEAMSAGTAIVASDIPSYREVCSDAALYFRLDAPHELAEHMRVLASDDRVRDQLIARGRSVLDEANVSDNVACILRSLERLA
jgi:glycosyltransferase involved in cell wall biosynthesis